jgi:acyl carrier protein
MTQLENNPAAIASILARYIGDEILGDGSLVELDENLLADGLVDSLGMLRLVGFVEASYSVSIPPGQFTIENFRNLDVISRYVSRLIEEASP